VAENLAAPLEEDITLVPTEDHPGFILMFVNEPPGIITGRAKGSEFQGRTIFTPITPDGDARVERLKAAGSGTILQREVSIDHVGRFYAKVALGMIVAVCGIDGFVNELGAVVRQADPNWHHWVGGTTPEMFAIDPPGHQKIIVHRGIVHAIPIGDWMYASAQIQLLACFGMPTFTVVAGQLREAGLNKLNGLAVSQTAVFPNSAAN